MGVFFSHGKGRGRAWPLIGLGLLALWLLGGASACTLIVDRIMEQVLQTPSLRPPAVPAPSATPEVPTLIQETPPAQEAASPTPAEGASPPEPEATLPPTRTPLPTPSATATFSWLVGPVADSLATQTALYATPVRRVEATPLDGGASGGLATRPAPQAAPTWTPSTPIYQATFFAPTLTPTPSITPTAQGTPTLTATQAP